MGEIFKHFVSWGRFLYQHLYKYTVTLYVFLSFDLLTNIPCIFLCIDNGTGRHTKISDSNWGYAFYSKTVLSGHSKEDPKYVLKTDNRLMQVKGIAECSNAILSTCTKLSAVFKTYALSIFSARSRQNANINSINLKKQQQKQTFIINRKFGCSRCEFKFHLNYVDMYATLQRSDWSRTQSLFLHMLKRVSYALVVFRTVILVHRVRVSEILPWDRKSYLTHATQVTSTCEIASECYSGISGSLFLNK